MHDTSHVYCSTLGVNHDIGRSITTAHSVGSRPTTLQSWTLHGRNTHCLRRFFLWPQYSHTMRKQCRLFPPCPVCPYNVPCEGRNPGSAVLHISSLYLDALCSVVCTN